MYGAGINNCGNISSNFLFINKNSRAHNNLFACQISYKHMQRETARKTHSELYNNRGATRHWIKPNNAFHTCANTQRSGKSEISYCKLVYRKSEKRIVRKHQWKHKRLLGIIANTQSPTIFLYLCAFDQVRKVTTWSYNKLFPLLPFGRNGRCRRVWGLGRMNILYVQYKYVCASFVVHEILCM